VSDREYPYVLDPKLSPAIWGGSALVERYGKHGDPSATLGESWECWDENHVLNGALAGETLGALRADLGPALTGRADPARIFPVLTKIIDAREALSVQVHPDDAYAQRVEGQPNGKTECWLVLACDPGAEIVLGWTRDTSREEYERRVADGTLGDLLRRVAVAPGDVFYLPAGTLHAIGAGIQIFETQQASDLTYRIFDWNRVGSDGKPRELHVAKAADVLDFGAGIAGAIAPLTYPDVDGDYALLIGARRFVVERVTLTGTSMAIATDSGPLAITAMDAHIRIDVNGESTVLAPWQTAVTPATARIVTLVPGGEETVAALIVRPDPDLEMIRGRALHAGCSSAAVDAFFAQFPWPQTG
jgi:mannose-6-phosphate isomerase